MPPPHSTTIVPPDRAGDPAVPQLRVHWRRIVCASPEQYCRACDTSLSPRALHI